MYKTTKERVRLTKDQIIEFLNLNGFAPPFEGQVYYQTDSVKVWFDDDFIEILSERKHERLTYNPEKSECEVLISDLHGLALAIRNHDRSIEWKYIGYLSFEIEA